MSDYTFDLLAETVGTAVRIASLSDSSLVVRRIATIPSVLLAAPAYLARRDTPSGIADPPARHDFLKLRFSGSSEYRWTLMDGERPEVIAPSGPMDADNGDVLTEWALAGEGIVLKPVFEVAAHLRSGALVCVMPEHPPPPVVLALLYLPRPLLPVEVRTFTDLALEELRRHVQKQMSSLPFSSAV